MNKLNLIRLGTICQKHFDMDDDFKIIELASDDDNSTYKIPIPAEYRFHNKIQVDFTNILIDEIRLEKLAFNFNYEHVRVGYGKLSNTLLIQEVDRWKNQ